MNFILTTCGLSILTNYLKDYGIFPKKVYKYSNLQESEINDEEFLNNFTKAIEDLEKKILSYGNEELKKLSAELNALVTFYNGTFDKKDFHLLLYTDTFLGEKVAQVLKYFLESKGLIVITYKAKDLNTSNLNEFHIALSDLAKYLSKILIDYKENNYEIIFNLTGGFKGVNSFLQTMASLYADKSIYIFETSDELLEIPRLPIKLDEEFFSNNIQIFRKFEIGYKVNKEEIKHFPKSIVFEIYDEVTLSPWGEIVWQKFKYDFYKKELVKPISNKLKYSKEFKKDFAQLDPRQKLELNKSIDDLEKYILSNKKFNPSSLRYHPLSGQISQKYSHEFYPFDGDASNRAYCNEKDGIIIIEKIDRHLK